MKTVVLILAVLYFPFVIAVTVAAMVYAKRRDAAPPQEIKGFAVVGAIVALIAAAIPLALLLRVF